MEFIGVDLGGTNIKVGRVCDGQLDEKYALPTPQTDDADEVIAAIERAVKQVMSPATEAVGIGVPSVVDVAQGIAYDVVNIPSWKKVPVKKLLQEALGKNVFVNNDANCFAMGERVYGQGQDYENFVGITLGTGVGAGIIQQGKLMADANCGSGEFSVVPYLDANYEAYCSSEFFSRQGLDAEAEAEKAFQGDPQAIKLFNQFGYHLAQLLMLTVATIDPQMIVFGGSISQAYALFETEMMKGLKDFAYQNSIERLTILLSNQKDQGVLGAAALCY